MDYFITESGNRINLCRDNYRVIGSGCNGIVYKIDDSSCVKLFDCINKFNYDTISKINKLKLDNFYHISDFIFDKKRKFVGYIMKYYKPEDIDILTMPTSYLLDNIYNIYNSVLKLTNNKVRIIDLYGGNVILNNDGITVIDTDSYCFDVKSDCDSLLSDNVKEFRVLVEELFYSSLIYYHKFCQDPFYDYNIFSKINSKDGITSFCCEFENYKYPIDYVNKLCKTRW